MIRLRPVLAVAIFVLAHLGRRTWPWPAPVQAAGAVGTWVFDHAAMHAQAIRLADVDGEAAAARSEEGHRRPGRNPGRPGGEPERQGSGTDPQARAAVHRLEERAAEMRAVAADPRAYFRAQFSRVASNPTASLKLLKDGTAVTTMELGGERKTESGTWSAKGRTVTVMFAGQDGTRSARQGGSPAVASRSRWSRPGGRRRRGRDRARLHALPRAQVAIAPRPARTAPGSSARRGRFFCALQHRTGCGTALRHPPRPHLCCSAAK